MSAPSCCAGSCSPFLTTDKTNETSNACSSGQKKRNAVADAENQTFEDHNLTWKHIAGRQIASAVNHVLVVTAPKEDGGYMWALLDNTSTVVNSGTAPTRAEGRRLAAFALGSRLGMIEDRPPLEVPPLKTPAEHSEAMRFAAIVILGVIFGLMLIAVVARVFGW